MRFGIRLLAIGALLLSIVAGIGYSRASGLYATAPDPALATSSGIHKIKHVIIIMQENRSFDSYFGTYPGADGIPMKNGLPTVCVPDPEHGGCQRPYHDPNDVNGGGPHSAVDATADIDGGKMDGFIAEA